MRKLFEVGDRVMTGCGCGTVVEVRGALVCVDLDTGIIWACDTSAPYDDERWHIYRLPDSKRRNKHGLL